MTVLVDTSVIIDLLRGHPGAAELLKARSSEGLLHASEITRAEVLVGMRPPEEAATRRLLSQFTWHVVDDVIAERAGELGREWLPRHRGIDVADLVIAATAMALDARILTCNVKHYPMFPELSAPY